MASQYVKAQGVTGPLSTAMPSAQELAANDDLVTELKRQNNYESPEETAKRYVPLYSGLTIPYKSTHLLSLSTI